MSTGTELLVSTSEDIKLQAKQDRESQAMDFKHRLSLGESVGAFTIQECFNTSGGEAEIYYCEKEGARYVCKYYYDSGKDSDILKKLKAMRHPNVISLIDYGKHKGYFYSILEYAEGGTLSDKIGGKWKFLPFSEEKTVQAVLEIIEGFKAIHEKGIIHRDIKPDNLFYRKAESEIMLGDFGISSLFQAEEGMTSHYTEHDFATEGYEAPEMYAIGKDSDSGNLTQRISPAIDYYALGVTIWALLTGKEPFVNEKGNYLSPGQIRRNALNKQTASLLIGRSPELSERMKKLIQGLLVTRHKERWDYQKIKDHLAGKDVEVFQEDLRDMPPFEIGGKKYNSFKGISQALLADPKEGKNLIFKGKLTEYLWSLVGDTNIPNAQADAEKIDAIIEDFSAKGKEDEGLYAVAYSLTPSEPYILGQKVKVQTMTDIINILETEPDLLIPVLRNSAKGFYAYFEVQGYGDAGAKVQEVVNNTRSDLKLIPRLQVAFNSNIIAPFNNDEINKDRKLKTIEELEDLPEEYLQKRLIIFIEMKKEDITAWIENLSGKDMDIWLAKYQHQKEWLRAWGAWKGLRLFLQGKDIQKHKSFTTEKEGKKYYGLRNSFGDEILAPVWEYILPNSPPNRFIVKKNGKWGVINGSGENVLPISYELVFIFDEERGLYQCKNEKGIWFIVDENGKTLKEGKEPLKIISSQGNPFDIVCDSMHYYNSQTFDAINKEGVKFEVAKTEDKNFIWQAADEGCAIYNGNGELQKTVSYSAFRVASSTVIVQKNNKWGIVSSGGKKEIIPCDYADIKSGGIYYALFMPGKAGGILCVLNKIKTDSYEKKDIYWLKFENSGSVEILPPGGGNVIASFKSIAHLGLDYTDAEDFAVNGKMACLSGKELLWFDLATGATTSRNTLSNGEADVILAKMNAAEVYALLRFFKEQNGYASMNKIISAAADLNPQSKTTWAATEGKDHWLDIMKLIDPAHTEGLSRTYDVFLSWMGIKSLKSGNNEEAYKYFSKAINLNSSIAAYHAGCGAALFNLQTYDRAVAFFEKAAASSKVKSITTQYLAAKGSSLFNAKKYKEAMAAFTLAIEETEDNATAEFYKARAACYQKLNMGDKAEADIATAARAPQSSGEAIRRIPLPSIVSISVNIEQVSKSENIKTVIDALDSFKKEGYITAMNTLIEASWQLFYNKKEYANTIAILNKLNPETATGLKYPISWYFNLIGICLYSAKSYSEALPYFDDACKKAPKEGQYFFNCGNAYYALKNWNKAAERYREAAVLGYAKANDELSKMRREGKI